MLTSDFYSSSNPVYKYETLYLLSRSRKSTRLVFNSFAALPEEIFPVHIILSVRYVNYYRDQNNHNQNNHDQIENNINHENHINHENQIYDEITDDYL